MNRKERRAARKEGSLDTTAFVNLADEYIALANRHNRKVPATDVHAAMVFAAARYGAHVAKNVVEVENQEKTVEAAAKDYADWLRQHLADPSV